MVSKVAVGMSHTLVVSDSGEVYGCGRNQHGQLSVHSDDGSRGGNQHVMVKLVAPQASSVAAGYYHSLLVDEEGVLYTCGYNNHGQCGHGHKRDIMVFSSICYGDMKGRFVLSASAGAYFSLALCTDGQVLTWGSNSSNQCGPGGGSSILEPRLLNIGMTKHVVGAVAGLSHCVGIAVEDDPDFVSSMSDAIFDPACPWVCDGQRLVCCMDKGEAAQWALTTELSACQKLLGHFTKFPCSYTIHTRCVWCVDYEDKSLQLLAPPLEDDVNENMNAQWQHRWLKDPRFCAPAFGDTCTFLQLVHNCVRFLRVRAHRKQSPASEGRNAHWCECGVEHSFKSVASTVKLFERGAGLCTSGADIDSMNTGLEVLCGAGSILLSTARSILRERGVLTCEGGTPSALLCRELVLVLPTVLRALAVDDVRDSGVRQVLSDLFDTIAPASLDAEAFYSALTTALRTQDTSLESISVPASVWRTACNSPRAVQHFFPRGHEPISRHFTKLLELLMGHALSAESTLCVEACHLLFVLLMPLSKAVGACDNVHISAFCCMKDVFSILGAKWNESSSISEDVVLAILPLIIVSIPSVRGAEDVVSAQVLLPSLVRLLTTVYQGMSRQEMCCVGTRFDSDHPLAPDSSVVTLELPAATPETSTTERGMLIVLDQRCCVDSPCRLSISEGGGGPSRQISRVALHKKGDTSGNEGHIVISSSESTMQLGVEGAVGAATGWGFGGWVYNVGGSDSVVCWLTDVFCVAMCEACCRLLKASGGHVHLSLHPVLAACGPTPEDASSAAVAAAAGKESAVLFEHNCTAAVKHILRVAGGACGIVDNLVERHPELSRSGDDCNEEGQGGFWSRVAVLSRVFEKGSNVSMDLEDILDYLVGGSDARDECPSLIIANNAPGVICDSVRYLLDVSRATRRFSRDTLWRLCCAMSSVCAGAVRFDRWSSETLKDFGELWGMLGHACLQLPSRESLDPVCALISCQYPACVGDVVMMLLCHIREAALDARASVEDAQSGVIVSSMYSVEQSASLSASSGSSGLSKLIDGSSDTYWQSDSSSKPHWLLLEWDSPVRISTVLLQLAQPVDRSYCPSRISIIGGSQSSGGDSHTLLPSRRLEPAECAGWTHLANMKVDKEVKWIKVKFHSNHEDGMNSRVRGVKVLGHKCARLSSKCELWRERSARAVALRLLLSTPENVVDNEQSVVLECTSFLLDSLVNDGIDVPGVLMALSIASAQLKSVVETVMSRVSVLWRFVSGGSYECADSVLKIFGACIERQCEGTVELVLNLIECLGTTVLFSEPVSKVIAGQKWGNQLAGRISAVLLSTGQLSFVSTGTNFLMTEIQRSLVSVTNEGCSEGSTDELIAAGFLMVCRGGWFGLNGFCNVPDFLRHWIMGGGICTICSVAVSSSRVRPLGLLALCAVLKTWWVRTDMLPSSTIQALLQLCEGSHEPPLPLETAVQWVQGRCERRFFLHCSGEQDVPYADRSSSVGVPLSAQGGAASGGAAPISSPAARVSSGLLARRKAAAELALMGFPTSLAMVALERSGDNSEQAAAWLLDASQSYIEQHPEVLQEDFMNVDVALTSPTDAVLDEWHFQPGATVEQSRPHAPFGAGIYIGAAVKTPTGSIGIVTAIHGAKVMLQCWNWREGRLEVMSSAVSSVYRVAQDEVMLSGLTDGGVSDSRIMQMLRSSSTAVAIGALMGNWSRWNGVEEVHSCIAACSRMGVHVRSSDAAAALCACVDTEGCVGEEEWRIATAKVGRDILRRHFEKGNSGAYRVRICKREGTENVEIEKSGSGATESNFPLSIVGATKLSIVFSRGCRVPGTCGLRLCSDFREFECWGSSDSVFRPVSLPGARLSLYCCTGEQLPDIDLVFCLSADQHADVDYAVCLLRTASVGFQQRNISDSEVARTFWSSIGILSEFTNKCFPYPCGVRERLLLCCADMIECCRGTWECTEGLKLRAFCEELVVKLPEKLRVSDEHGGSSFVSPCTAASAEVISETIATVNPTAPKEASGRKGRVGKSSKRSKGKARGSWPDDNRSHSGSLVAPPAGSADSELPVAAPVSSYSAGAPIGLHRLVGYEKMAVLVRALQHFGADNIQERPEIPGVLIFDAWLDVVCDWVNLEGKHPYDPNTIVDGPLNVTPCDGCEVLTDSRCAVGGDDWFALHHGEAREVLSGHFGGRIVRMPASETGYSFVFNGQGGGEWGFKCVARPVFNGQMRGHTLKANGEQRFRNAVKAMDQCSADFDEKLLSHANRQSSGGTLGLSHPGSLHFPPDSTAKELLDVSPDLARLRFAVLLRVNEMCRSLLPSFHCNSASDDTRERGPWGILSKCRHVLFTDVKSSLLLEASHASCSTSRDIPTVVVDRRGGASVFRQLESQLRSVHPTRCLREDVPFRVQLVGESAEGDNGPFREALSSAVQDITSREDVKLNMLFESEQGWFFPKCGAISSLQACDFAFIGRIIGVALASNNRIALPLSPSALRCCVGLNRAMSDLEAVDKQSLDSVRFLSQAGADAVDACCVTWTVTFSDKTVIDLVPDGSSTPVNFNEVPGFVRQWTASRLHEAAAAEECIRDGLRECISGCVLNLLQSSDLMELLCGSNEMDVELLRQHTCYRGGDEFHPQSEMFWQVLASFSQDEREQFLRFVWGRSRLPRASDFKEMFKLHTGTPRGRLPRADTCFFTLTLPEYDDVEDMKAGLLFAMNNCAGMDGDERGGGDVAERVGARRGLRIMRSMDIPAALASRLAEAGIPPEAVFEEHVVEGEEDDDEEESEDAE